MRKTDPSLDINGWDAAHKAIILASLAYGFWLDPSKIFVSGIEQLTASDIRFADDLGYRIKLLATIRAGEDNAIEVRVCPTLIPKSHVLASVNGVFNAIAVRGDIVGETFFYGRGAGQDPTSSSVLADLAEAAVGLETSRFCYGFTSHDLYGKCQPLEESDFQDTIFAYLSMTGQACSRKLRAPSANPESAFSPSSNRKVIAKDPPCSC